MMQPPNDDWMLCHPLQVYSRQIFRNNKFRPKRIILLNASSHIKSTIISQYIVLLMTGMPIHYKQNFIILRMTEILLKVLYPF
jgi:hypothetical protein